MKNRGDETRDVDGLEVYREAILPRMAIREGEEDLLEEAAPCKVGPATAKAIKQLNPFGKVGIRYVGVVTGLLEWLIKLYPVAGATDFVFDAAESSLALVPPEQIENLPSAPSDEAQSDPRTAISSLDEESDWREEHYFSEGNSPFVAWLSFARRLRDLFPEWSSAHDARLYRLYRWLDEPRTGLARRRPELDVLLKGWAAGAATSADVLEHLIGPRSKTWYSWERFDSLRRLSNPDDPCFCESHDPAALRAAVDQVVARIIEIELVRGETPTAASKPALSVNHIAGVDTLIALVAALGKTGFAQRRAGRATKTSQPS